MLRSPSEGAGALPRSFALLCWNVHKNPRAVAAAQDELGDATALLLMQEAIGAPAQRGASAVMAVSFRRRRDRRPTGVLTVSTAVPTAAQALLSPVREPLARTPKSALITTYTLADGRQLLVANVHGINFRQHTALARQLTAIENAIAGHRGPAIVAGDFNTWSRRRRQALAAFEDRLGLRRALARSEAARLDAVLYRGLTVTASTRTASPLSDHDALRVNFESTTSVHTP